MKTITLNGITFEYLSRPSGDLIVVKGKKGYVWSQAEPNNGYPAGVFHATHRPSVAGEPCYPYETPIYTLIEGVDAAEFKAVFAR